MNLEIKFNDMLEVESNETIGKSIEKLKEEYEENINELIHEYNNMVVEFQKKSLIMYTFGNEESNKKAFNIDESIDKIKEKKKEINSLKSEYSRICRYLELNYKIVD